MNLGDTKRMDLYHKRAFELQLETKSGKDRKLAEILWHAKLNNGKRTSGT